MIFTNNHGKRQNKNLANKKKYVYCTKNTMYKFTVILKKLTAVEKALGFKHVNHVEIHANTFNEALLKTRLSTNFTFTNGKNAKIYQLWQHKNN